MGQRAYKLKIQELKQLCDFFAVNRTGLTDKDALVDQILDFLGEPAEKFLKHKGGSTKKKRKGRKYDEDDDDDPESSDEESDEDNYYSRQKSSIKKAKITKGKNKSRMPTDGELRRWVNAYIMCHNMEKSTLKHALEIAGEKFGVDLSSERAKLKQFLADAL
jgi:hypothetical protein